jgi:NADH:ubiquinone oxidoreductase subunit 5 (subunit L)/multisubunit Na+/H+ antiporter MnhA subunit
MIYQGIIEYGAGTGIANQLWIIWLGLTVLGSALTLASFVKFIGGIFLGRQLPEHLSVKEVPLIMWLPQALLALLCICLGVFATSFVVPQLIQPVSGVFDFPGFWNSWLVSVLVIFSLLLGIALYLTLNIKKFRSEDSFIGGEKIQDETSYPATDFYNTVKEFRMFSWMYSKAGDKWFDIYDLSKRSVLWLSHQFSEAHAGILTGYVIWAVAGLIIMLLIMIN